MKIEFVLKRSSRDIKSFPIWDGLGKFLGAALIGSDLPGEWICLGDPTNWVARVSVKAIPNGIEFTVFPETTGSVVVPIHSGIRITFSKDEMLLIE